ncbi:efflux RND transporter periplasmic adaptor subunit [Pendulispora albinea]|uniref:Efflux RND transporter periplasmic adaptor subunit n=1 Tax=Pendulispora albinea TaxID=2741071 RepID=A0ABZ2M9L9_9BACT
MNRRRAVSLLGLGMGMGTFLFLIGGCSRPAPVEARESEGDGAIAVRMAPVEHGPYTRHLRVAGVVHRKSEVNLAFLVGGIVTKVTVHEGDRVRKGQVLATLDPTAVDARRTEAVEGARKAERDLARVRVLHASGAVPAIELENAQTNVALARAAARGAQFHARHATLVAPEAGVVDQRHVDVGEVVAPGSPAFHVSGSSQGAVVRAPYASRDVVRMRVGDPARVVLDVAPEAPLVARVSQIAAAASPGTGGYEVELALAEPPPYLLSGLTAKVETEQLEPASAVVPVGALLDGDALQASAYVVEAGKAKRVPVTIRSIAGDRAVLASGLEHQELVVKAGISDLRDGAPVRVLP